MFSTTCCFNADTGSGTKPKPEEICLSVECGAEKDRRWRKKKKIRSANLLTIAVNRTNRYTKWIQTQNCLSKVRQDNISNAVRYMTTL